MLFFPVLKLISYDRHLSIFQSMLSVCSCMRGLVTSVCLPVCHMLPCLQLSFCSPVFVLLSSALYLYASIFITGKWLLQFSLFLSSSRTANNTTILLLKAIHGAQVMQGSILCCQCTMFVPQQILSLAAVIKHKHLQLFMWYKFFQTLILYSQEIGYDIQVFFLLFYAVRLKQYCKAIMFVCIPSKLTLKLCSMFHFLK